MVQSKNIIRIIKRELLALSEIIIGILDFWIFPKSFFQKHKKCSYVHNFGRIWLFNELVLNFSTSIKYAKAQFNPIILSRVIEYTTYYYYRQTDTFVKSVFSDSWRLKTQRYDKNSESIKPSHMMRMLKVIFLLLVLFFKPEILITMIRNAIYILDY